MTYGAMTVVFFAIDIVWLGFIGKGLYDKYMGHLLRERVNWTAAIVFYALFILGVLIFAVQPGLEKESLRRTALLGGLFGLFTYATYDLTNLATLKGFPLEIVFIDIAWGILLCTLVASAGYIAATRLF
jgi:uncharacterized membrane protein